MQQKREGLVVMDLAEDKRYALQRAVCARFGGLPLRDILVATVAHCETLKATADALGTSEVTLGAWLAAQGINTTFVRENEMYDAASGLMLIPSAEARRIVKAALEIREGS